MAKPLDYSHIVQSYFDNEMSIEERLDFEQLIGQDPQLKQEFDLQKEVIEGIREYRRHEIKAHLSTVAVGGIVWTNPLRWAVGGGSTLIAAVVGYFIMVPATPESYSEVDFGSGVVLEMSEMRHVPNRPEAIDVSEAKLVVAQPITETSQPTPELVVETQPNVTATQANPKPQTEPAPMVAQPTITLPQMASNEMESPAETMNPEAVPGANFMERSTPEEKVELELKDDRKYTFHYQFFNNKLFLFGDFEGKIYEIIEFNSMEGRDFYLYFRDNFYPIQQGQQEITKLEKLEDSGLVERLKRYRQNNLR